MRRKRVFNKKKHHIKGFVPTQLPFFTINKNVPVQANFVAKNYHFRVVAGLDDLNAFLTGGTHPSGWPLRLTVKLTVMTDGPRVSIIPFLPPLVHFNKHPVCTGDAAGSTETGMTSPLSFRPSSSSTPMWPRPRPPPSILQGTALCDDLMIEMWFCLVPLQPW